MWADKGVVISSNFSRGSEARRRRRGDRVQITTGKYAGRNGTVESDVYQRTVDYPEEWGNGFHVMLDSGAVVTIRWDQVESDGL